MARSSKDIAKRLRFDHRPRPDAFRRWYLLAGLGACLLASATWLGFGATVGERQYLPGPLTPAHATFGDRCAHCHVSFASTPDEKCLTCHSPRVHSEFEVATPACRDCHIEHRREDLLLTVSDRACVDCHGNLQSRRTPLVATRITGFADHPEFAPLRAGDGDPTALRFNHRLHLSSATLNEDLACASCHVVDADGPDMRPIVFETHCERCHALQVTQGVPAPMSEIKAAHVAPAEIRPALTGALLALGARRAEEIFAADQTVLLPGRAARGPVDESRSLLEFQHKYLDLFEAALYRPFVDSAPLLESNQHCFLCHLQGAAAAEEGAGLPVVVETKLPARWLSRGGFSHRRHDKLPCATCHPAVEDSALTSDLNLPGTQVCAQCHADNVSQSAGTECTLCHAYHDTGTPHAASPLLTIETLVTPR
jgi:hypothetical protein